MVFQSSFEAKNVDVDKGVIYGASVITSGVIAKGHAKYIDDKSLESFSTLAKQFKKGVKVGMGHWSGIEGVAGLATNFEIKDSKLRCDIKMMKNHPATPRLMEMASEIPESFGLSVAFSGDTEELDGRVCVRPVELYSIDFVSEPAANPDGLFSEKDLGITRIEYGKTVDTGNKCNVMNDDSILSKIKALLGITDAPSSPPSAPVTPPQAAAPASSPPAAPPAAAMSTPDPLDRIMEVVRAQAASIEALNNKIEAMSADPQLTARRIAMDILAQAGGTPVPNAGNGTPPAKSLIEQYAEIRARDPREAGWFYLKNKAAMFAER